MRTENVAVMLTDMKGFTAATSRQSRAENERMLALQDELVLPVVRAFGGRRVKTIGDAYLVLFRSPTAGVLCGMAIQDRLWDYGRRVAKEERIEVLVACWLCCPCCSAWCLDSDDTGNTADTAVRSGRYRRQASSNCSR